ncbi:hypothetical protein BC332_17842 [Capsicum chinense]|nr:hypothetical protein BC332_17842 [Capsicum chinense]
MSPLMMDTVALRANFFPFLPLTPLILWNMSIDPTKLLDPPMPSYTLTIYNLYLFENSKFKDYDSLLGNRFTSWQARANHLASVLENGDAISANRTLVRPHDEHESEVDNEKVPVTSTHFTGQYVASFTLFFFWFPIRHSVPALEPRLIRITRCRAHPGSNPGALVKGGAALSTAPQPMLVHLLHTEQVKSYLLIDTGSDLVW